MLTRRSSRLPVRTATVRLGTTSGRLSTCAVLLGVLSLPGCAAWMSNAGATAELQLGYTVASQRALLAEQQLGDVLSRVDTLEQLLRDQGMGQADGFATMDQLARELATLRGRVEELGFQSDDLTADLEQVQVLLERRQLHDEVRLNALEGLLGVSAPPAPAVANALVGNEDPLMGPVADPAAVPPAVATPVPPADDPASGADSSTAGSADPGTRLMLAEERMEQGEQVAARAILDAALKTWPDDELVAVMRYRRAETLFNEGKYKEAARGFQGVSDDHTDQPAWASLAMLRIGECFDELGRSDGARTFYDGVVRKYPDTDAAKTARARLNP